MNILSELEKVQKQINEAMANIPKEKRAELLEIAQNVSKEVNVNINEITKIINGDKTDSRDI
jgi:ERCC4-type nuclease